MKKNSYHRQAKKHWKIIGERIFQKVSYPFIYYKLLEKLGRETIVSQIEQVKKLSDDVYLIDYDSRDGIKEICDECGIKYYKCRKTPGVKFHISKCFNMSIFKAKYDFVVPVNFDCIYPANMSLFITEFFKRKNPRKILLFIRMHDLCEDGSIKHRGSAITVYHRPSIMKIRGWDERIGRGLRSFVDRYIIIAMENVLGMRSIIHPTYFAFHKKHPKRPVVQEEIKFDFIKQIELMTENINNKKFVKNSYW